MAAILKFIIDLSISKWSWMDERFNRLVVNQFCRRCFQKWIDTLRYPSGKSSAMAHSIFLCLLSKFHDWHWSRSRKPSRHVDRETSAQIENQKLFKLHRMKTNVTRKFISVHRASCIEPVGQRRCKRFRDFTNIISVNCREIFISWKCVRQLSVSWNIIYRLVTNENVMRTSGRSQSVEATARDFFLPTEKSAKLRRIFLEIFLEIPGNPSDRITRFRDVNQKISLKQSFGSRNNPSERTIILKLGWLCITVCVITFWTLRRRNFN